MDAVRRRRRLDADAHPANSLVLPQAERDAKRLSLVCALAAHHPRCRDRSKAHFPIADPA
jgi:hypothetical protein